MRKVIYSIPFETVILATCVGFFLQHIEFLMQCAQLLSQHMSSFHATLHK